MDLLKESGERFMSEQERLGLAVLGKAVLLIENVPFLGVDNKNCTTYSMIPEDLRCLLGKIYFKQIFTR